MKRIVLALAVVNVGLFASVAHAARPHALCVQTNPHCCDVFPWNRCIFGQFDGP